MLSSSRHDYFPVPVLYLAFFQSPTKPHPRDEILPVMDLATIRTSLKSPQGVLCAGAAIRLALFLGIPSLCHALERRPELSTPLTSFRSLKEGVFIHDQGSNPYDGGVFFHSPLYLLFFTYIVPVSSYLLTLLLWTSVDIGSAIALVRIWKSQNSKRNERKVSLILALFLFNPYTLLSCLAKSTTSIDNAILLSAIAFAATGQITGATFLLALASHASLYPLLLLPPLAMLLKQKSGTHLASPVLLTAVSFVLFCAGLTGIIYLTASQSWIEQSWGVIINVNDLTPNVGMWWYFFTEMFDHFRTFFLGVFQLHNLIYVAPICLRLSDDPLFAILIQVGIISTWKSYPALGDMAVWAGLLGCFPDVVSNLRHPLFTLTVHLYTSILLPLLHSLWLLTGTGNANFFYAATMVYGLNASLAVVDALGAGLRLQVKKQATDALLREESEDRKSDGYEKDPEMMDEIWEQKGWSVVQFASSII
uniref:Phosphatidylinositol glycan, class U n=1 Tax=Kwoniella pini CBS 10737 TaxID=1296096 RepID=A0A1B9I2P8_9TREE|nr:uncharacterized protein I206_04349 [Kwoniella pini CBS 10737]OCF49822.1 hypothetical protein I206_04349 [Kwoniella pini CBS 10737]